MGRNSRFLIGDCHHPPEEADSGPPFKRKSCSASVPFPGDLNAPYSPSSTSNTPRTMGQTTSQAAVSAQVTPPASCPMHNQAATSASQAPAQCPVPHTSSAATTTTSKPLDSSRPAECPIKHESGDLNPLNQMPTLSQAPAASQSIALPTERTASSIPRTSDVGGVWEYPSPQQFYNALVRKGWETPEEHVETMVHIHNFLNERAWDEVMKWEKRRDEWVIEYYDPVLIIPS